METFFACLIIIFVLISIYIILCKLFISMLCATGLSRKVARFQIFSAIGSTGFTTKESELIMIDSKRRRIILAAIIIGWIFSVLISACLIGVVSNLNFDKADNNYWVTLGVTLGICAGVLILIIVLTTIKPLRKVFFNIIRKMMYKNLLLERNEIIYEESIGTKYLASVKIFAIPSKMRGLKISEFPFNENGLVILAGIKNNRILYDEELNDTLITKNLELQVYGRPIDIVNLFGIKAIESENEERKEDGE